MVFLVALNVAAQWVIWPLTFLRVIAPSSASTDPYEICGIPFHDDHPYFAIQTVSIWRSDTLVLPMQFILLLLLFYREPFMREMLQDNLDK